MSSLTVGNVKNVIQNSTTYTEVKPATNTSHVQSPRYRHGSRDQPTADLALVPQTGAFWRHHTSRLDHHIFLCATSIASKYAGDTTHSLTCYTSVARQINRPIYSICFICMCIDFTELYTSDRCVNHNIQRLLSNNFHRHYRFEPFRHDDSRTRNIRKASY